MDLRLKYKTQMRFFLKCISYLKYFEIIVVENKYKSYLISIHFKQVVFSKQIKRLVNVWQLSSNSKKNMERLHMIVLL